MIFSLAQIMTLVYPVLLVPYEQLEALVTFLAGRPLPFICWFILSQAARPVLVAQFPFLNDLFKTDPEYYLGNREACNQLVLDYMERYGEFHTLQPLTSDQLKPYQQELDTLEMLYAQALHKLN